mgnify:CR=1 FL=1
MKMRRLKDRTIKRYDHRQLTRHLDRLLDLFDEPPYQVNWAYKEIYFLTEREGQQMWLYHSPIAEYRREKIIDTIQQCYKALEKEGKLT